jgi:hypothetical protein
VPLYYIDRHENGTLSTTFADEYTHVLHFQTYISCDACAEDEAFASEYPDSFGDFTENGDHRNLHLDSSQVLNAGLIFTTIDHKFSAAVPEIGRVGEVSVLPEQRSLRRHMRSYYFNEEVVRILAFVKILLVLQNLNLMPFLVLSFTSGGRRRRL